MREIYVADSETDPFKYGRIPKPFIWGTYNGCEYNEFHNTDDFVKFISDIDCIVYAHNGGKFDWHFILEHLEQFEPIMIINGRLAKFRIGKAEFRDSLNILPIALKEWEKDDFDYSILEVEERHKPENKIKISNYLKSDCVNLYGMVSEFIARYGLNLTLAGSAMKVWQKIANTKVPKTNAVFYNSISPFYYGGRVECFELGIIETNFKVIDINSAYPDAMKHIHPYGNNFVISDELPKTRAYIERAFITVECVSRGAFPFRGKDSLIFPNDAEKRTYTITGWEFLAAIETKTIDEWEILEVLTFPDSISFEDYIDHFYAMKTEAKENGDKASYTFAKLFLNTLYGKFGANPEKYQEYTVVEPQHIEAAEVLDDYTFCVEMGPWALMTRPLSEEKSHYYNVAVAASITGYVRAKLWRAINAADGVMYCDTDSIVCRDTGKLELNATKLGMWDIEADCDYAAIAGKKLYAFRQLNGEWKTASKGVRLDHNEIIKVANGETVRYTPESPSFSLKRGIGFIPRNITKNS